MINIIAAVQKKDLGLGYQNKLLFRISDDLKNFKNLTLGNVVIMGRKTFESIGKPLPNRENIVITRNLDFKIDGVKIVHSLDEALNLAQDFHREIFIIGGADIYKQSIPFADRLYLTLVESGFKADAFFPDYGEFKTISKEEKSDEKNNLSYEYLILEK